MFLTYCVDDIDILNPAAVLLSVSVPRLGKLVVLSI